MNLAYNGLIKCAVYLHCAGGRYRVIRVLPDATNYEQTENISWAIEYEQLDAGKYPAGTVWVRSEVSFLNEAIINGKTVQIFTLQS